MYASNGISGDIYPLVSLLGAMFQLLGILLIPTIIIIISQWKIYKKAGKKGWECLIPIYNIIVLLQIVELPIWYIALFFVPFANIYATFKIYIELAHKFGKSTGFGVLTVFFNIICFPFLAFSKDCIYQGNNNCQNSNNINNTQNLDGTSNFVNHENQLNNNQQPIVFDQKINTEINTINPLSFEQPNLENNQGQNNNINFMMNNQQPELNTIPMMQNQTVESNQTIQTISAMENPEVNLNSINQEQTSNQIYNNQLETTLNNQSQGINIIPNFQNNEPTINNENTNSLLQQQSSQQPELNVIPGMQNQTVDLPQLIQTQNIVNIPESNMKQPESAQPITFNGQQPNNTQVQGINVISTLAPTPTIQNTNNNQNM